MLDFADFIVINKFEKRGGRMHCAMCVSSGGAIIRKTAWLTMWFRCTSTIASQFNDAGVNRLFAALCQRLDAEPVAGKSWRLAGHRH